MNEHRDQCEQKISNLSWNHQVSHALPLAQISAICSPYCNHGTRSSTTASSPLYLSHLRPRIPSIHPPLFSTATSLSTVEMAALNDMQAEWGAHLGWTGPPPVLGRELLVMAQEMSLKCAFIW